MLIGVDDAGQAVGLSRDYESLGEASHDPFELHLRNVLNQHLGGAFVASKVQAQFHAVGYVDVYQVDITHSQGAGGRSGEGQERSVGGEVLRKKWKLVSGIPMSEMSSYIREHIK